MSACICGTPSSDPCRRCPEITYYAQSPCCEHGNGPDDAVCCLCSDNPCDGALENRSERLIAHARQQERRLRDGWEREVAYVLAHGKREELPF